MIGWIIAWWVVGIFSVLSIIVTDVKDRTSKGRTTDITVEMVLMGLIASLFGPIALCFVVYCIWEHYNIAEMTLFKVGGKKNGSGD